MKNNESKYKQVVNFVIDGIAEGKLQKGDWIPSINEFRENYRLSRDTVFAGLSELKSRGIIASTPGVGYYIASARIPSEQNIFLLFNEFNEFKEDLYNSFMEHVGKGVSVDLYFHNYNRRVFDALVTDANGKYTTYIIMPGKFTGIAPLLESLSGRVFLLDHFHPELLGRYSSVAQNFEKDTYEALCHGLRHIRKYERLLMVQHEKKEPQERYDGLVRFCAEHGFGHEYLASIRDREIREGDLFILVSDRDLVTLLKQAERQQMTPGREFGIISYNDTPLKEILAGGITTLEEKSLGCTQKAGASQVVDVLRYGERLQTHGLNLLSAPGNDAVATSALAGAGCHMVLFSTGRGTPYGGFVPTVKIATNSELAAKKKHWIDFDAGQLIHGKAMPQLLTEFVDVIVDIANGKQTCNEKNDFRELAIFKSGVTL